LKPKILGGGEGGAVADSECSSSSSGGGSGDVWWHGGVGNEICVREIDKEWGKSVVCKGEESEELENFGKRRREMRGKPRISDLKLKVSTDVGRYT